MIVGWLTTSSPDACRQVHGGSRTSPPSLVLTLVMLVWGVASEALRDIITGFLDQVRFD
jgi:hypothetical protein